MYAQKRAHVQYFNVCSASIYNGVKFIFLSLRTKHHHTLSFQQIHKFITTRM